MSTDKLDDLQDQEIEDQEELEESEHELEEEEEFEQSKLNRILEKRLSRDRAKTQKMLKDIFGTTDLRLAGQYYQAGQAVARASGKSPQEVLQRLHQQQQTGQVNPSTAPPNAELQEIKDILLGQRELEQRERESKAAKKEFGSLFDEYQGDIEDLAEERGLSLVDAAAVVLRPHLGKLYEQRTKDKSQKLRKRKVEGSDGAPAGSGTVDYDSALTPQQKDVARRMGVPLDRYYARLKQLGRLDE